MIMKMFAMYDSKAESFGQPSFLLKTGQAVRALMDTVSDPNSVINHHPQDFALYEVGEYDTQNAVVTNKNPHTLVALASDYSVQKPISEIKEIKAVS